MARRRIRCTGPSATRPVCLLEQPVEQHGRPSLPALHRREITINHRPKDDYRLAISATTHRHS